MSAQKIGAVYMQRGSTMFYCTGARGLSGLLIPAKWRDRVGRSRG
jgi:hypothetical protein